jgi:probable HAF family extracellular repeat protein
MKHMAQNGLKALTSAWVLALLATVERSNLNPFRRLAGNTRWAILLALTSLYTMACAQQLIWLGTGGGTESTATGVSDDGNFVCGYIMGPTNYAFLWDRNTNTMQTLPTLGGRDARAFGISPDGRYVVGWAMNPQFQTRPVRWLNGVPTAITNAEGIAFDVDNTGNTVGYYLMPNGYSMAFLWDGTTLTDLGHLGGGFSQAYALASGSWGLAVVGRSFTSPGSPITDMAFLWKPGSGMTGLGSLGGRWSWALGISRNGQVVVGTSWITPNSNTLRHAFRWSANQGMVDLGVVSGGLTTEALACTFDGTTIVGWGVDAQNRYVAFRWTQNGGMEDLNQTYASLLQNGSRLGSAGAISPDGCYIVGWGYNAATGRSEAFLLITCCVSHNGDVDNNGCIDDADLLAVLFAFGSTGSNLGRVDVNCDGVVDDADLLQVLFNFGSGC